MFGRDCKSRMTTQNINKYKITIYKRFWTSLYLSPLYMQLIIKLKRYKKKKENETWFSISNQTLRESLQKNPAIYIIMTGSDFILIKQFNHIKIWIFNMKYFWGISLDKMLLLLLCWHLLFLLKSYYIIHIYLIKL